MESQQQREECQQVEQVWARRASELHTHSEQERERESDLYCLLQFVTLFKHNLSTNREEGEEEEETG